MDPSDGGKDGAPQAEDAAPQTQAAAPQTQTQTQAEAVAERHAGWNELFFDLVVVAGVSRLAHLLHEGPDPADLALYLVLYLAFWVVWSSFAVYGNIAAEQTRTRNLLLAMLGMAVMAASVSGLHASGDVQAVAFVAAYVALRWFAGRVWKRGQIVTDWPLAQLGLGATPWLISLLTPEPWRPWLWALGIAIDLVVLLTASSDATVRNAAQRYRRAVEHRGPPPGSPRDGQQPVVAAAHTDSAHLAERLGLYVIIVLGEGLIQVIDAAADEEHWNLPLAATGLGAFALLAAIWTLSLRYGYDGVPGLQASTLAPRYALFLHALLTATLAALAAALGLAVAHADGPLPAGTRMLLCGAMTLYFLIGTGAALTRSHGRGRLLRVAVPCALVPVVLAAAGQQLPTPVLVWLLAATVGGQILHHSRSSAALSSGLNAQA
ncbi:low temperature requirement protein A [Streptomyces monticola]|uniref:Low temperature requirement protein A n=1 Tax=Streptomyces monticola TaxID=2666263 RepID=A0ABW2JEY7_9ACTN